MVRITRRVVKNSMSISIRCKMNESFDKHRRRIPQTPRPAASRPYLPPAGHIEANLAQSGRTYDQNVDGDLAPPVG